VVNTFTGIDMPHAKTATAKHISAFLDGELHGETLQATVDALSTDPDARAQWHLHHVVGDVLRSEELAANAPGDLQFLAKLEKRLANEPIVSARLLSVSSIAVDAEKLSRPSANANVFQWRLVAGAALTVAMAVLVGGWYTPGSTVSGTQQAATAPAPTSLPPGDADVLQAATTVSADGMIRDPRLDQLLSAHQQWGGHSALQVSPGFLRNATYDGKGR